MWEDGEIYAPSMIRLDEKKISGPVKLTSEHVAAQRAFLSSLNIAGHIPDRTVSRTFSPEVDEQSFTQTSTPINSDNDEEVMTEDQRRLRRKAKRLATKGNSHEGPPSVDSDTGGAGGLAIVAYPGKTDTWAAQSRRSKT
jgi:hypothetical protein